MRLVDVDELGVGRCSKDVLPAAYCAGWNGLLGLIKKAPTVDAVPVVHAQWIEDGSGIIICPECKRGYNLHAKYTHYCPNCGAKMDGERKDGGADHE